MNDIQKITKPVSDDIAIFESKLRDLIINCDSCLKDALTDFLFSDSKRLRPIFVLLFAKILNINNETVFNIALASELIHSASLLHDDIIDNQELRRGIPAIYKSHGIKAGILSGDLLLSLALEVLSNTSLDILNIYSSNIKETIIGEIYQNSYKFKIPAENDYINKTLCKTVNIFLSGLMSLFSMVKIDDNLKEKLISYMKDYAIAFQIKNDIANFISGNNSDIKNGNYTLPVIYFCIDNSTDKFNEKYIEKFNINKEFYLKKSDSKVLEYKLSALGYLNGLNNSIYKDTLTELTNYTLRSSFEENS